MPLLALAACNTEPPPKPLAVTTDGKAIAEICGVPESMFSGRTREPVVTLAKNLTAQQQRCTLREVRRLLPSAQIVEAGAASPASPSN